MDEEAATRDSWTTYLVEGYRPGIPVEALRQAARRLRATAQLMAREGKPVRYVRSAIVPQDESCFVFVEAASENFVHELYSRADVQFDRITTALPDDEVVTQRRVRHEETAH